MICMQVGKVASWYNFMFMSYVNFVFVLIGSKQCNQHKEMYELLIKPWWYIMLPDYKDLMYFLRQQFFLIWAERKEKK